jgi:hypothetical protein
MQEAGTAQRPCPHKVEAAGLGQKWLVLLAFGPAVTGGVHGTSEPWALLR